MSRVVKLGAIFDDVKKNKLSPPLTAITQHRKSNLS